MSLRLWLSFPGSGLLWSLHKVTEVTTSGLSLTSTLMVAPVDRPHAEPSSSRFWESSEANSVAPGLGRLPIPEPVPGWGTHCLGSARRLSSQETLRGNGKGGFPGKRRRAVPGRRNDCWLGENNRCPLYTEVISLQWGLRPKQQQQQMVLGNRVTGGTMVPWSKRFPRRGLLSWELRGSGCQQAGGSAWWRWW